MSTKQEDLKKNSGEAQRIGMAVDMALIKQDMEHLKNSVDNLAKSVKEGFDKIDKSFTTKSESDDMKRRLDKLESWQTWALRLSAGGLVSGAISLLFWFVTSTK